MANQAETTWTSIHHFLLYDGVISDIIINYSLIILCIAVLYLPGPNHQLGISYLFISIHSLVFLCLQEGVWFLADAYGVSLVWSGQLGLLIIIIILTTDKLKSISTVKPHLGACLTGGACIQNKTP